MTAGVYTGIVVCDHCGTGNVFHNSLQPCKARRDEGGLARFAGVGGLTSVGVTPMRETVRGWLPVREESSRDIVDGALRLE